MTVGYEGLNSEEFFKLLHLNGVEVLIDVRELPLSRKPGFSKLALANRADAEGIRYEHIVSLGCPREIRHDYRGDLDWGRYTGRYLAYLDTQLQSIVDLAARVVYERCCLMCFEADPNFCHRSFVADRVKAASSADLAVRHLSQTELTRVGHSDLVAA